MDKIIPVPPMATGHTHFDWCHECQLGRRDTSAVAPEDLNTHSINLHALCYASRDPSWAWQYEAPPPKWLPANSNHNAMEYKNNLF